MVACWLFHVVGIAGKSTSALTTMSTVSWQNDVLGTHRRPAKYVPAKRKAHLLRSCAFNNYRECQPFAVCLFSFGSICSFIKWFIEGKLLPIQCLYANL